MTVFRQPIGNDYAQKQECDRGEIAALAFTITGSKQLRSPVWVSGDRDRYARESASGRAGDPGRQGKSENWAIR